MPDDGLRLTRLLAEAQEIHRATLDMAPAQRVRPQRMRRSPGDVTQEARLYLHEAQSLLDQIHHRPGGRVTIQSARESAGHAVPPPSRR